MANPYATPHYSGQGGRMISENMITTTFELPAMRVRDNRGIARGIIVRSRSIVGNFFAGIQTIFGGDITLYTHMCEQARMDAYMKMITDAEQKGANAIIGMRFDATEIGQGLTEVLCYGTAVVVEAG